MRFSKEQLIMLSESVKERLSEKRFNHTLSVQRSAERIGEYFKDIDLSELSAAALLHDVTKEISLDEQRNLFENNGLLLNDEDRETTAIWHSLSAPLLIKRDFSEFATADVLSAVRNHTTGNPAMSVFDRIVFIADYVEELRSYDSCIEVRSMLFSTLSEKNTAEENEYALNKAVVASLGFTENEVLKRGRKLNYRSRETKEYFCRLI